MKQQAQPHDKGQDDAFERRFGHGAFEDTFGHEEMMQDEAESMKKQGAECKSGSKDVKAESSNPISMPQGPITRARAKKLQQALILHLQGLVNSAKDGLQGDSSFGSSVNLVQYNVIQVQVNYNGLV